MAPHAMPQRRGAGRRAHPSVDDYFALLRPIVRGIAQTFGRKCEVVLHDFRDSAHSIVMIEGTVTNRHVGGSVTQIGLGLLAQGDAAEDQINYITRTPGGGVLKSSTLLLRDPEGRVFGALCVNFDITDLRIAAGALYDLVGTPATPPSPVAFVDDIGQVIRAMIDEEEASSARSFNRMSKDDRLEIIRALDRRGAFALQRSVPLVAAALGVSRATAYSYLEQVRAARVGERNPDGRARAR